MANRAQLVHFFFPPLSFSLRLYDDRLDYRYKQVGQGKYSRALRSVNEERLQGFNELFNQKKIDSPVDLLVKAKSYFRCCKAMLAARRAKNLESASAGLSSVDHPVGKYMSVSASSLSSEYKFDSESQKLYDSAIEKQCLRVSKAADRNLEYIEHQMEWIAAFQFLDEPEPL